jgi:hypothetical protein
VLMEKVQSSSLKWKSSVEKTTLSSGSSRCGILLVQQGLQKALAGRTKKPTSMTNEEWEELDAKALSTIRLCLADEVLFNIVGEDTTIGLWSKLESLYMTKSLTSRIFLKKQLYSL